MIVPQFWAEARAQHRERKKQITVRRFGWSDTSQDDAQQNAEARVQEALQRLVAGDGIPRREPRVSYNGADGVPIREEILERHGDVIITRNLYGARCLNTPDVLFADVDVTSDPPAKISFWSFLIAIALGVWIGISKHSFLWGMACSLILISAAGGIVSFLYKRARQLQGGEEAIALKRLKDFLAAHPAWRLRLYRTPAGLRLLAMHRRFDPAEPEVGEFFSAIGTDPVYVRMCQNQHCFRARVSPKPWRIGIEKHLRPRPGVWPVKPEHEPRRREWVAEYEAKAATFASCRYVSDLGNGTPDPGVESVCALHDEMCRANTTLPIA